MNLAYFIRNHPWIDLRDWNLDKEAQELSVCQSVSLLLKICPEINEINWIHKGINQIVIFGLNTIFVELQFFEVG